MPAKKPKSERLVRCVVCHCLTLKSHIIDIYADPVCSECDDEMLERDEELYSRDMQAEIDRVWGYGQ